MGRWLCLFAAVFIVASQIGFMPIALDRLHFGRLGVGLGVCDADRFCEITRVRPESPAFEAGLAVGQRFRIENPVQAARASADVLMPGERVLGNVGNRTVTLTAREYSWTGGDRGLQAVDIQLTTVSIIATLLGVVLAFRSRGRPAVLLLAAGVVLSCAWGTPVPYALNSQALFPWSRTLMLAFDALAQVCVLAFAVLYRREITGERGALTTGALILYAIVRVGLFIVVHAAFLTNHPLNAVAPVYDLTAHLVLPLTLAVMGATWRKATPELRDRLGVMIPAVILYMTFPNMGLLVEASPLRWTPANPVVILTMILPLLGLIGLIYAVLRHRMVDLGFVINRTLVYGVLSTLLILVFWFAEWGLEKLLPRSLAGNLLISAGFAFVLFLFFERARAWVKDGVEHLFFRRWHENEAQLKRFVHDAAFITREKALLTASLAELSRFAAGARVALFEPRGENYARVAGDSPEQAIDADQPALVRLRADRTAQDQHLPRGTALMVPIAVRSEIAGFFLFGPKPGGESYRPDERAVLAEAGQALGQHLQTLHIDAQARALTQLEQQNDQLRLALSLVGAKAV